MRSARWEYKSLKVDVTGWIGPKIDHAEVDAALNAHGAEGWELVSAFDLNRGDGGSATIVALFKRARD